MLGLAKNGHFWWQNTRWSSPWPSPPSWPPPRPPLPSAGSEAVAHLSPWGTDMGARNTNLVSISAFGIITSTRSMSMPQGSVAVSIIVWKQILQLISRLRSWSRTGSDQSYLESTSNGLPLWQQLGESLRPQNVPGQRWLWIPKKFWSLTWEWSRRAAWSTWNSRRRCRPQPWGSWKGLY